MQTNGAVKDRAKTRTLFSRHVIQYLVRDNFITCSFNTYHLCECLAKSVEHVLNLESFTFFNYIQDYKSHLTKKAKQNAVD